MVETETQMAQKQMHYQRTQVQLFVSTLTVMRLVLLPLLCVLVIALALPSTRTIPFITMIVVVAAELGVIQFCCVVLARGRRRLAENSFVICTQVAAMIAALVIGDGMYAALATTVLVAITALLRSPRAALLPGSLGMLATVLIMIGTSQGWFVSLQLQEGDGTLLATQIVFTLAALGVFVGVIFVVSGRLAEAAAEAQKQAHEAETARASQLALSDQLEARLEEQERLLEVIHDLEVPAVPVLPGVLVLPLVSHLDSARLEAVTRNLLAAVYAQRASYVLVDVTGVPAIDTAGAAGLLRLAQSVRLLGCQVALTGLRSHTAGALVALGADLRGMATYATIQDALGMLQQGSGAAAAWQRM